MFNVYLSSFLCWIFAGRCFVDIILAAVLVDFSQAVICHLSLLLELIDLRMESWFNGLVAGIS